MICLFEFLPSDLPVKKYKIIIQKISFYLKIINNRTSVFELFIETANSVQSLEKVSLFPFIRYFDFIL